MEVKPGYKQTEIGTIPEDWELAELGIHATFKTGPFGSALHRSDYVEGGIPVVNPMQIVDGRIRPTSSMAITEGAARKLSEFRLSAGDVVIGRRGDMGRCAVVRAEEEGWLCGTGSMIIRTGQSLDSEFLQRMLSSPPVIAEIENASVGTTMINMNQGTLGRLLIPFPPDKTEQEAIATALRDVDALIDSVERLLTKKRDLKQGAMQELLRPHSGDVVRPLGEVSTLKGRIGWQGLKQTEFTMNADEPFLITGMNFKDGAIAWDEVYHVSEERYALAPEIQLKAEDVLMTKDGTIGKLLYVERIPYPGKASLNSHLLLFRPIKQSYVPKYLYYQLGSQRFQEFVDLHKSGTTFFGISQSSVAKYQVFLPSLGDQQRIARTLSDMDAEIAVLEERLSKARLLKQGMMQELLTGRIRLV
ncbi:MAG TPA: restriction endonuclease subunit S [Paludibaculum sp.]|jgi:type I restriction enzyme S subunit